ncbi:MAG: phosphotransferase-like protein [Microthrixaceae bacterium]
MSEHTPADTQHAPGLAIVVNGASSSGKSRLCGALQLRLTELADGDPAVVYAGVAFDDMAALIATNLYPHSFVELQDGDVSALVSRAPHDGRAAWEYVDERDAEGIHGGHPRVRVVLGQGARRLLSGVQQGWGAHIALGTNLIIDHFLQEQDWVDECLATLQAAGATVFTVGVECSLEELERREAARSDGAAEVRPLGLARRSDELCRATTLTYDVTVSTSDQTTDESVDVIIAALRADGHLT